MENYGKESGGEQRAQMDQDRLRSNPSRYYKDIVQSDKPQERFPESGTNRDQRNLHSQRGPEGYRRSDERIRDIITDMIQSDQRIDSRDMDISVHEGRVRLTGYVPDTESQTRIASVVEKIPGIRNIENDLKLNEHANDNDAS